jgi:hypothetical protein
MFPTENHDLAKLYKDWRGLRPEFERDNASLIADIVAGKGVNPNRVISKHRTNAAYRGRVFEGLPQDNLMAQERINIQNHSPRIAKKMIAQGNAPTKEFRVHSYGGEVVPGLSVPRYYTGNPLDMMVGRGEAADASKWFQEQIRKLPKEHQGIPYAADIAPVEGGGFRVVELNPGGRSGVIPNIPGGGQRLYKHLTGRYTPEMSAFRGLGLGAAGAGATAGGMALHRHFNEDK